jgi:hypothetical protein
MAVTGEAAVKSAAVHAGHRRGGERLDMTSALSPAVSAGLDQRFVLD